MVNSKTRRIGIPLVAIVVFGAGTALGVTMTSMSFNPLEPAQGAVPDSSLHIESETLSYTGLDATTATLKINNTDSVDHTGSVYLDVLDSSGTSVASANKTGVSFAGNGTLTTVALDFTDTNVSKIDSVEVRVEETG